MKRNRLHRGMALLLAVCMMLTMNGGFAFAAEEPLPMKASTTETSGDAPTADSGKEYLADPMGSATEGETPSVDAPVCTCNPVPGISSVEGHGKDCPLYEEPEPPKVEQGECTCPPVDSGEVVHGADCPLYTAPEKPAAPQAPINPLAAVYALIDALPTLAELEAVDTEGADFPAYLEKLKADVAAARAAYDALTPAEREAFDPARLQKLAEIEGLFGVSTMALAEGIPVLDANNAYQNVKYTLTAGTPNTATISGVVDKAAVIGVDNVLTIPVQVKTTEGITYNVTAIGSYAFAYCTSLKAVTVPSCVTSIEICAFREIGSGAMVTLLHETCPAGIEADSFETDAASLYFICAKPAVIAKIGENYYYPSNYGIFVTEPVEPNFNTANQSLRLERARYAGDANVFKAKGGYAIFGLNNGAEIRTSYNGRGFDAYIITSKWLTFDTAAKYVRLPGEGVETYVLSGIWAKAESKFVAGGKYLRVTYTLRNSTNKDIPNVSLGMNANMEIGNDDKASIYPTPTGFRMVNTKSAAKDPAGSGMQFTLNCTDAPGVDNVDSMWYGNYGGAENNMFKDLPNKGDLIGIDSGVAFSWQKMTIPANSSLTRSVVYGVSYAAPPPVLPADKPFALKVSTDLNDLKVTAKVTDEAGRTDTLYYTVNGGDEGTLGSVAADGNNEKKITGEIPVISLNNGDNTVSVWVMNDKDAMSKTVTFTVTVKDGAIDKIDGASPETEPDTIPVTITATPTDATTYNGTDGSIAITASGGQGTYQYSKDNTNWQDGATLTGLAVGDYTVYARDNVDTANATAGTSVTVKQPSAPPTIINGENQTPTYGTAATVSVTATAADGGTLSYQWSKSGTAITGATGARYTAPADLAVGTHSYTCEVTNTKTGTTRSASATGVAITVTVSKATPAVTLTADKNTPTYGETITLTATVAKVEGGAIPTGTVIFKDGGTALATVAVTRNATSGHGEAVYNYAIPISHGAITATYTAADTGNYNSAAPASVSVTVGKKPLTITVTAPASLTYNGTAKAATLAGATGLTMGTDYTLTYSTASPTNVGDYTATFALTMAGAEKYTASGTLSVSFAITKAAGVGSVTCGNIVFGGTVTPVPVSATNSITNVSYLYKAKTANDSTYTATAPANVGSYTVKATFAAVPNYTEATATASFDITPAAVTGITVTPYSGEYDGTAHDAVTVTGTQSGDKVFYMLPSASYTETMPTVTTVADSKSVMVKVTCANHTDFVSSWISAAVAPRVVTVAFTLPAALDYDGEEKTVTAAITNKCGADDVALTLTGNTGTNKGKYTATASALTGTAAGNYKLPSPNPSRVWEITGKAFPFTVIPPTAGGITYGQPLSASTLTGNNSGASVRFSLFALLDSRGVDKTGTFAWKDGTQVLSSGTQTAVAVFTPTDTNYSPVDCNVTIAVAKKDVTVAVSGTKVYGAQPTPQSAFTVTPSGMLSGETALSLLGTLAFTSDGNTEAATVGSYAITVAQSGESNYRVTTSSVANGFTVTNATITGITVTPYDGIYDGVEHPRATASGTQPGDTVTYSADGSSFSGTAPTVQAVTADAPVYVKVSRANHDDFTSEKFSAQVEPREIAVAFTLPANLVYDSKDKTVTAAITNKCGTDDVALTLGNATGKAVGKYTTTVTGLSGAAAGNYNLPSPAPEQKWEITGTPYPHEIVLPTAGGIIYGKALSDSTLTGNNGGTGSFAWNDGAILPPSGSYTATVVFTPTDTNFAPVTRTVQVAVAKKDVTVTVSGTKAYHTPPIANADFVVSNITGMVNGETDAALLGTLTLTSDGNKQAAIVGSYNISVAQSGESNYSVTTTSVTDGFTVTRAAQTLSGTVSYTKLLTDKDFALDVKTDSTDPDAAVTYTLTNDGGGAVTLDADGKTVRMKKPGTATITANAAQTANFSAAAPLTITVTIGSNPAVRALATEDITTTGAKIGGVVTTGTIATTGYGLEYKKASDADYTPVSANETATGDVKTLTHTLAGLEKNTEYVVRIWAKTADKTFESVTRFRTAAEQPPTGKVEGEITDNSGTSTAITVTIEAGNTVIASHTVKAGGGTFTFELLPDGFYNLVADNGKYKVTRMVEIVKGGAVTNVQMEIGRTQSVVEIVTPETPNVAVDGLPELFGNDTMFTQDNKDVIAAGGTVEFKLLVEKKDTPADAEEIDKIAEGKVGVYLDIGLRKTVTDQNGREQESELVPDLGANEITIVIPLPKELQGKQSYTVYRVHNGTAEKLDSTHNADGNTLTIQSSLFSTYAIAYTEKSGGTGGGSGGSSSDNGQYDFWMTVKDKIQKADGGDVVKVNAKGYDKMPWSVMDALYKNDSVSLVITWNGKTITIPAGKAQKNEPGRIYWPLSLLAELYADIAEDAVLKPAEQTNPTTGGPGKYIPVTGGDLYEMTAPMAEQVTQPAAPGNAGATQPKTPAVITPPDAGFEPDAFVGTPDAEAVKTNSPILWVVIAGMLTAAAVACGVWFWKRKEREQA